MTVPGINVANDKKMKKKLLCYLCVAAMCLGFLTGCGGDFAEDLTEEIIGDIIDVVFDELEEDDSSSSTYASHIDSASQTTTVYNTPDGVKREWTVLLYLCGTNLESVGGDASDNIQEILDAKSSDNINFVIETGGADKWFRDDISTDYLSRYIKDGDELKLMETDPLARMSDVKTYTDFLTWGVEQFPAEKYMLIVWDHGMGSVDGVISDELYDEDLPSLSVKDIAQGIAATGKTFELVGFDACLMSTLEQAAALCPYAKYMVASEETEPCGGWDYTAWLNYLVKNTDATGGALGTKIVDSYYNKCADNDEEKDCTLAVTDLAKIPKLVKDYNAMTEQMKGFTDDTKSIKVITGAFKKAENYGGNNILEDYTDMVDLGDFILNAEGVLSDTGETVIDDLLDAVVYHKNGIARSKGEGLAVYVPLSKDEERFDRYAQNAAISGDYLRFLEALYDFDTPEGVEIITRVAASTGKVTTKAKSAGDYTPGTDMSGDREEIKFTTRVNDDGYMEVNITSGSDIIDNARCNLYRYSEEEGQYYYCGSDYTDIYISMTTGRNLKMTLTISGSSSTDSHVCWL